MDRQNFCLRRHLRALPAVLTLIAFGAGCPEPAPVIEEDAFEEPIVDDDDDDTTPDDDDVVPSEPELGDWNVLQFNWNMTFTPPSLDSDDDDSAEEPAWDVEAEFLFVYLDQDPDTEAITLECVQRIAVEGAAEFGFGVGVEHNCDNCTGFVAFDHTSGVVSSVPGVNRND